jgi:hypothetical protein
MGIQQLIDQRHIHGPQHPSTMWQDLHKLICQTNGTTLIHPPIIMSRTWIIHGTNLQTLLQNLPAL